MAQIIGNSALGCTPKTRTALRWATSCCFETFMSKDLNHYFVPDLCNSRAVVILLAVSEALVLAMTLIESSLAQFSWQRFSVVSFFVQWVCLLSVAVICPLRPLFMRLSPWLASSLAVALVALVTLLVSVVGEWLWPSSALPVDWLWVQRNMLISGIFAAMAMRYFYVQSQWRLKAQAELRARLAALQANIRPHFFFNTLNTVASLIVSDPDKAERMLLDLAQLFRAVLKQDETHISLQQEIDLGQRYLAIEQVRLGDRLRVQWQLPDPLPELRVPQLLLQPLLENAVYHGVAPSLTGGHIDISLQQQEGYWCLSISNSKPEGEAKAGNQLAQANIQARLAALGRGARLQVQDGRAEYLAKLYLPLE